MPVHRQRGLSLVELLIAMTLGLVLTLGASAVFLAGQRNLALNEELSRRQERLRFAKEWLARDLRQLGYLGCGTRNKNLAAGGEDALGFSFINLTDLSDPGVRLAGVGGIDGDHRPASLGDDLASLPDWHPAPAPDGYPHSDILTMSSPQPGLRILDRDLAGDANLRVVDAASTRQCAAKGKSDSSAPSGLCDGDLLIAADCDQAVLFVGTNVTQVNACGDASGPCTQVVHSQAKTGGAGNTTSVWRKQVEGFGNGAELIRVAAVAYFVAASPLNGEPALMRCELPCSAATQWEELVPGLENLQVWYRRGTETELLRADQLGAADWAKVTALRLRGVLRGSSATPDPVQLPFNGDSCESPLSGGQASDVLSFSDGRPRRDFCFTVALRNRLN